MPKLSRRPSAATFISLLALFVALGGPAEAAKLLVGSKNIKKNAVSGKHVKNRSLTASDLSSGTVEQLRAVPANGVTTPTIADGAVTATKVAAGAIGGAQVADRSLQAADLAANSVSAEELAPNSVQGDEIEDGRMSARDVGSFAGTLAIDFAAVDPGTCVHSDQPVAAVATTTPARTVADDAVVVTPPASFPDDRMLISAAPSGPSAIRVRVCNAFGADAIDLPSLTYRYISFDF